MAVHSCPSYRSNSSFWSLFYGAPHTTSDASDKPQTAKAVYEHMTVHKQITLVRPFHYNRRMKTPLTW